MTVVVCFVTPRGIGSANAPGIGDVRVREDITVPGSTTAVAEEDEVVIIGNGETSMVVAAFGRTPDAATTTETSASSAGFPVAAGSVTGGIVVREGDKINIKAIA